MKCILIVSKSIIMDTWLSWYKMHLGIIGPYCHQQCWLCILVLNKHCILWIAEFLTNRPQFVVLRTAGNKSHVSSTTITNTGAPQGCVISPILYTILYTSDCRSLHDNVPIIKYADDTSIQGLIKNQPDIESYKGVIDHFVS